MLLGCNCGVQPLSGMRGLGTDVPPNEGMPPGINPFGPAPQCNTAGGYSLVQPKGYSTQECMTAAQLAQVNAAYDAAVAGAPPPPTGNTGGTGGNPPAALPQVPPIIQGQVVSGVITSPPITGPDIMLGSFDATAFVRSYWVWLAAGAAGLVVLTMIER